MEAALLSPTSFNMQNWRFLTVTDAETRQAIEAAAWNQKQISECSLLVVLCGDLNAWLKDPGRYWRDAPDQVRAVMVPLIEECYAERPQLQRDEAMRSVGIAAQTLMLAAKAMGYDSCPMIGFDADEVARIINLPENHVVGMLLPIGKAVKPANPRAGQLPYEEVVFRDRFPDAGA